jgi:hypothetical protein
MASPDNNSLLQDIILELQISNENVSGIETGVTMLTDDITRLSQTSGSNERISIRGNDKMHDALNKIGVVNLNMLDTVNRLYKFFMDNDMIRAEENRKLLEAIEGIEVGGAPAPPGDMKKGKGLLGILATVAVFAAGLLIGFFSTIIEKLKKFSLYGKIAKIFTRIQGVFTRIGTFIRESKLGEKIKNIWTRVKNFFGPIGRFFGKVGRFFGKMLKPVLNMIRNMPISKWVGKFAKVLGSVFRGIGKVFGFVTKLIGSTGGGGFLSKIFKIGKTLGRVLGKLALPITIIMALVESVIGAFEGYKEGGIMGAIKGGLKGLLNSLIGWIIDIPKDLISWILNAFGFEDASKWLDSWDFASLFDGLWDFYSNIWEGILAAMSLTGDWLDSWSFDGIFTSIKDFFFGIWDGIIDWLNSVGEGIADMFGSATDFMTDFYRKILKAILPDRNKKRSFWDPVQLVATAIPDKVYDWANASSGSSTSPSSAAIGTTPSSTGGVLGAAGGGGNTIVVNQYMGGSQTNVSNSNTGGAKRHRGGGKVRVVGAE